MPRQKMPLRGGLDGSDHGVPLNLPAIFLEDSVGIPNLAPPFSGQENCPFFKGYLANLSDFTTKFEWKSSIGSETIGALSLVFNSITTLTKGPRAVSFGPVSQTE